MGLAEAATKPAVESMIALGKLIGQPYVHQAQAALYMLTSHVGWGINHVRYEFLASVGGPVLHDGIMVSAVGLGDSIGRCCDGGSRHVDKTRLASGLTCIWTEAKRPPLNRLLSTSFSDVVYPVAADDDPH